MYNFLKQKYGLNNMVIEWAFGIIDGIQNYATQNIDVALFGYVI